MKPKFRLLPLLFAFVAAPVYADTLYWDSSPGTADGTSQGGTGTWDTSTGNWDNGVAYQTWNNGNNDTAVFGGTAGTVTINTVDDLGVAAGGVTFGTANYTITGETLTLTSTATISNAGTATISSVIAGSAGLTKTGNGTLQLGNDNNTFTGNLTISAGTLQLGTGNNAGSLGGGSYAGDISIATGATFFDWSNTSQTLSGVISGGGTLIKSGGGTLTLSGNNTYTGKTIIGSGGGGGRSLSVSSFNSVNGGTPLMASSSLGAPTTIADGTIQLGSGSNVRSSTLIYTGSGETTDRVMNVQFNSNSKHTITSNATDDGLLKFTSDFTITPSTGNTGSGLFLRGSGDGEVAQIGTMPGFLEKADAGTWTIGGTNAANSMVVSGGELLINGTYNVTTTVGVSSGATLGGSGTVGGAITINNGGTLSPGNSAGQFTVGNSLVLAASSSTQMELGGTTLGATYDNITIDVAGSLAYGGNLNVENLGLYDMDLASFTYDLFDLNGVTPNGDFASVTVNSIGLTNSGGLWTGANGDVTYSFAQSTGDLTITAIPEPRAALLGGLGMLALLRRRR